jgi:DNA repair exonuclease SbcCD ATPase subunit
MQILKPILIASTVCLIAISPASAQQKAGGLVCWKDKAGKTIGCGDKVPPEFQDNAATTLNKRGVSTSPSEAPLTPEQKQAQSVSADQKKIDAQKLEETRRRDRALLDSFSDEKEIDLKRTRDIQQLEVSVSALQSHSKNLTERQNETRVKLEQSKKENKPTTPQLQQDYDRLTSELAKNQEQVAQKRKEITEKNAEFDAMKKRFAELKGGAAAPAKK